MRARGWMGRFSERRDRRSGSGGVALLRMGSILFRVTLSCFGRSRPTASGPALLRAVPVLLRTGWRDFLPIFHRSMLERALGRASG